MAVQLLEKSIGKTFSDINCIDAFLGQFPKAIEIKKKKKKKLMGSNQTYKFCIAKETINKQKDNPQNGKKNCKWYDWQGSYDMIANELNDKIQVLWHFPLYTNRSYNSATKNSKKVNSEMGRISK